MEIYRTERIYFMKQWIRKMYESSVIRYIFFGGCTTMVNLVSFFILRKLKVELNIANIISIILAILFAYVVNSKYVFQDKCETLKNHVQPFCKFVSANWSLWWSRLAVYGCLYQWWGLMIWSGNSWHSLLCWYWIMYSVNFLCLQQGNQNNEGKERENS